MSDIPNSEVAQNVPSSTENQPAEDGKETENQLLKKLAEYEKAIAIEKQVITALQKDLQTRTEERDNYKNQILKLEKELKESLQKTFKVAKDGSKSEDIVTNATSVIFERTKVCKNQELQIEALNQQINSLKEIVGITKDLLDIRNTEVQHLQDRITCMEKRFNAEKEGQSLMQTRLERMVELNAALKQEYEKQLGLVNELKKSYIQREHAVNLCNTLTDEINNETPKEGSTSTSQESTETVENEKQQDQSNETQ